MVLQRRTDTYRTGALACRYLFEQTILFLLVDILFPVIGDIDEGRFELHQRIEVVIQRLDVLTFQRREYFNGEEGFARGVFYVINYFHEKV